MGKQCMSPLGQFLEDQRRLTSYDKAEFARFLGISPETYYRLIRDKDPGVPSDDTLFKISQKLNVAQTDLYRLKNSVEAPPNLTVSLEFPEEDFQQLTINEQRAVIELIRRLRGGDQ